MPFRKINNLVKYNFDSFMSKGIISLIAGLFILSVLFVIVISIIGALVGIATTDQQFADFGKLMWDTVLHSLDGGVLAYYLDAHCYTRWYGFDFHFNWCLE